MSITDELRDWKWKINTRLTPNGVLTLRSEINCIADRIDAALEEWYIELPKDADGMPIRIGDRLRHENGCFIVTEMTIGQSGAWRAWDGENGYTVLLRNATHVQPDSWERIIEDAQADGVRYHNDGKPSDFDALVERCKRLAELVGSTKKNVGEEA